MHADATAAVQELLQELVDSGAETGLQAAAYLDGELMIDAVAGAADPDTGRPVDGDTLFTVFSTTKGVTTTCIHMLAERGQLDYDAPIARYWPEFGVQGKERVTVRDALTHRAAVPQMPEGLTPEDLCDWDGITAQIAALPPLWEPGTQTGYHAYTFGWILGEVLRRIDGRPIATFVQEEICTPLGIRDLFLGIPDEAEARVAPLISEALTDNTEAADRDALLPRAIPPQLAPSGRVHNRPDVRRASIPAGGGIMNARAIARHYAALIGEVDGVRLLPPERVRIATQLQTNDVDLALGFPIRKALGYWLGGTLSPMSERNTAFGHPGAGGSTGFADPEYGLAVGFTKNRLVTSLDPAQAAAYRVGERIRESLGVPSRA